MQVDLYGIRPEGDTTEAAWIGNREIVGNRGNCLIVKVRVTLKQRGGGISRTWIGSRSEWRQVNGLLKSTSLVPMIVSDISLLQIHYS